MLCEHRFDSATTMVRSLCDYVVRELGQGLAERGRASLVVSGGRTPAALFDALSEATLAWEKVWITLADERWVDPSDAQSNEHLVREHLLRARAASAHFVGLKNDAASPEEGAPAAEVAFRALPQPFELVLLGLGEDGHTASLFPGASELGRGLALDAPFCLAVHPPAAPYARMSLSARSLLHSRAIVFLIEGAEKWAAYQRAREAGPVEIYPSRAFFHQSEVPVHVYWSR
ncbi:MAG: 6-phosphogluconolactonase [Burkholderiaceae bacterium]|jgi:6-phosphogluconolactonase